MNFKQKFGIIALSLAINSVAVGAIDVYHFDNPRQEAQYRALIEEFRCPKCQNQNLAGSDAPIAKDLKQKTYEMVMDGRTDGEIRDYMFERYGDFISYKPAMRPSRWILWFFPPILLVVILFAWFVKNRNQNKKIQHIDNETKPLSQAEQHQLEQLLKSDPNADKQSQGN